MSLRLWFPNAPSGTDVKSDRQEIAIGVSAIETVTASDNYNNYVRRYLDDVKVIVAKGSGSSSSEAPGALNTYFRRYLDDV